MFYSNDISILIYNRVKHDAWKVIKIRLNILRYLFKSRQITYGSNFQNSTPVSLEIPAIKVLNIHLLSLDVIEFATETGESLADCEISGRISRFSLFSTGDPDLEEVLLTSVRSELLREDDPKWRKQRSAFLYREVSSLTLWTLAIPYLHPCAFSPSSLRFTYQRAVTEIPLCKI